MKNVKWTVALLPLLLVWACQKKEMESVSPAPTPVTLAQVQAVPLARPVHSSGRLEASAQMRLSFKIGGIVDAIPVVDGQRVRRGQALATLRLDEIDAQMALAQAGRDKAKRDLERVRNLHADSVATLEQLQNAQTGLDVAEAQFRIAQFNRDHAVIAAPSDGQVLTRLVEAHELVSAGMPVVVFASEETDWRVQAGVADVDVVTLSLGDKAKVTLDAYPDQTFHGTVAEIAGAPDPQNGTYPVAVAVEDGGLALRSGMVAKVAITPARDGQGYTVPLEALVDARDRDAFVYVVNADSTARRLPVVLSRLDDDQAVIASGLESVDHVVARGAAYLNPGTRVRVMPEQGGRP